MQRPRASLHPCLIPAIALSLGCGALGVVTTTALGSGVASAAQIGVARAPLYRLGPGDRLSVSLFQLQGFNSSVSVLPDGTVSLPRIGSVPLWGLTLDQARGKISRAYERILRRPLVYLDLVATRPVRVSVSGEVQRPGLYSIGLQEANQLANSSGGGQATTVVSQGWPTLVEAIQKAGGLTAQGDLRRVTLMRPLGTTGRTESFEVNYWEALRSGAPISNPLIYDGDSIRIPLADKQDKAELLTIASSSFAPASITVNVVGEVERPGPQQVRANSPLSFAVQAAGGVSRRGNNNTLELFRLHSNGTMERRQLAYRPGEAMGDGNNPPLRNGDVVVVDRHGWAKSTDGIKAAVEPLGSLVGAASIFSLLGAGF